MKICRVGNEEKLKMPGLEIKLVKVARRVIRRLVTKNNELHKSLLVARISLRPIIKNRGPPKTKIPKIVPLGTNFARTNWNQNCHLELGFSVGGGLYLLVFISNIISRIIML
jgi:hypothetical protein